MPAYGHNIPTTFVITVVSGTGSKVAIINGKGMGVGVIPPTSVSVYDIDISDNDSFVLVQSLGLTGTNTIENNARYWNQHLITIANASVDGDYKVKIWFE